MISHFSTADAYKLKLRQTEYKPKQHERSEKGIKSAKHVEHLSVVKARNNEWQ